MSVIDKEKLHNMVKSGMAVAKISEVTGWSANTIYSAISRMGLRKSRMTRETVVKEKEGNGFLGERICPECGKIFYVAEAEHWAYRPRYGNDKRLRCSWGCLRKTTEAGGEKR